MAGWTRTACARSATALSGEPGCRGAGLIPLAPCAAANPSTLASRLRALEKAKAKALTQLAENDKLTARLRASVGAQVARCTDAASLTELMAPYKGEGRKTLAAEARAAGLGTLAERCWGGDGGVRLPARAVSAACASVCVCVCPILMLPARLLTAAPRSRRSTTARCCASAAPTSSGRRARCSGCSASWRRRWLGPRRQTARPR